MKPASIRIFGPFSGVRFFNKIVFGSVLFSSIFLSGCAGPETEVDPLMLSQSDSLLVEVLIDLHSVDATQYVEALARLDKEEPVAFDFTNRSQRDSVLAVHGLDEASFMMLVEEHLDEPDRFLMVYNRVLDRSAAR